MSKRFVYSDSEDVRMLKWVVRHEWQSAIGIGIWRDYIKEYQTQHTDQSLNGRMRRMIAPNLDYYAKHLTKSELVSLYKIFGPRLTMPQKIFIQQKIANAEGCVSENRKKMCRPADINEKNRSLPPQNITPRKISVFQSKIKSNKSNNQKSPRIRRDDDDIMEIEIDDSVLRPKSIERVPEKKTRENLQQDNLSPILCYYLRSESSEVVKAAEKTFCAKQWNMEMKPVAEQGVMTIYNFIKRCQDRASFNEPLPNFADKSSLEDLFEKMFSGHDYSELLIISVNSSQPKYLRARFFFKIADELMKSSVNPHVRSAVSLFFLYLEYQIALYASNTCEQYCESMNRLLEVATQLITL